jgi:hypothetical protein
VYIHESVHADLNSQILRLEKLVQNWKLHTPEIHHDCRNTMFKAL